LGWGGVILAGFGVKVQFLGLICSNLGGIWRNGRSKKTLFYTFCDDFLFFCGKLGKITVFDGKLTGEKRGFVGFWGLNGDFLFFAVKFG